MRQSPPPCARCSRAPCCCWQRAAPRPRPPPSSSSGRSAARTDSAPVRLLLGQGPRAPGGGPRGARRVRPGRGGACAARRRRGPLRRGAQAGRRGLVARQRTGVGRPARDCAAAARAAQAGRRARSVPAGHRQASAIGGRARRRGADPRPHGKDRCRQGRAGRAAEVLPAPPRDGDAASPAGVRGQGRRVHARSDHAAAVDRGQPPAGSASGRRHRDADPPMGGRAVAAGAGHQARAPSRAGAARSRPPSRSTRSRPCATATPRSSGHDGARASDPAGAAGAPMRRTGPRRPRGYPESHEPRVHFEHEFAQCLAVHRR